MEYNTVNLWERTAHMRKGIGLCLTVLAFMWLAPAWGEEAPRIMWLDADSGLDYATGAPWICTLETDAAGTVTVTLADASGVSGNEAAAAQTALEMLREFCPDAVYENGNVMDYLLCANTADLRNFPASAYYYTNRQLTKSIGWND